MHWLSKPRATGLRTRGLKDSGARSFFTRWPGAPNPMKITCNGCGTTFERGTVFSVNFCTPECRVDSRKRFFARIRAKHLKRRRQ